MSERSPEAERVDESIVDGSGSSIESDIAASGTDGGDAGLLNDAGASTGTGTEDSHASDVAAGYDDPDDAPVSSSSEEDGSF
jgi:hypothetical protein